MSDKIFALTITEVRHQSGPSLTEYTYTGQYSYTGSFGLMYYNARWYDPALGRFAQADTTVPPGVQGLDRYAYVNNSPMNYVDSSGHMYCDYINNQNKEDCEGGQWRNSTTHGETPGELINLYKRFGDGEQLDDRGSSLFQELSSAIEIYMKSHSGYDIKKDPYLHNPGNYMDFYNIRHDYWQNRCEDSPGSGCDILTEPDKLYEFYDLHNDIQVTMFDPSRIDWTSTGLDSASFTLGVAALIVVPEYAIPVNLASQGFGAASGFYSFNSGDNTGGWLSVGGFVRPPIGTVASGASVIRDISAGFYEIPYIPPIGR